MLREKMVPFLNTSMDSCPGYLDSSLGDLDFYYGFVRDTHKDDSMRLYYAGLCQGIVRSLRCLGLLDRAFDVDFFREALEK